MSWIQVSLKVPADSAEAVGQALIELGSLGVWENDPDTITAYFPAGTNQEQLQAIVEEMKPWLALESLSVSEVPDQDWVARWKASLVPLRVTPRLVIVPSWQTYQAGAGEQVVVLDPGMAFGTGHHETTRMCLELLDESLERGGVRTVLDLGTGSGILAIAAARLGANRVVAAEIDPVAREAAEANVRANAVSSIVGVVNGDEAWGLGPYDLVLANLTAEDLQVLLPRIETVLAPNGHVILSGILISRESIVADALRLVGLPVASRRELGEWVALTVARQESSQFSSDG